jgi:hypothetical protein
MVEQAGGKLIVLEPNEKLEHQESKRPSQTFNGFVTELQRDIAFGSLPFEFVANPQALGGASIRLVTAKAARVFGKYQTVIIETFCQPTWDYIIADGIASGAIPDDPKWYAASWTTPKSVTVDGGRDAANDRADVELGLLSMSELYAQRGLDFKQELSKRADDMNFVIGLAKDKGLPVWMLYKPGFNWLQQGQANSQLPTDVADNLDLPPPPNTSAFSFPGPPRPRASSDPSRPCQGVRRSIQGRRPRRHDRAALRRIAQALRRRQRGSRPSVGTNLKGCLAYRAHDGSGRRGRGLWLAR